jgi:hypothetical protein
MKHALSQFLEPLEYMFVLKNYRLIDNPSCPWGSWRPRAAQGKRRSTMFPAQSLLPRSVWIFQRTFPQQGSGHKIPLYILESEARITTRANK